MVRMSQSKISRIETGAVTVSPRDAGRLARALGASPETIAWVTEQAELSQNRLTDMRSATGSIIVSGRSVASTESGGREFRVFQPVVVVGLAQTAEYARAVLLGVHDARRAAFPDLGEIVVAEAVSARVRRQEVLNNPDCRFFFVMTESVLSNAIVAPEFMLAQIKRLQQLADRPNVELKIIPTAGSWSILHLHGFEVIDDGRVVIDVLNTSIITSGSQDVTLYRHAFDELDHSATGEIRPILESYRRHYLKQLY